MHKIQMDKFLPLNYYAMHNRCLKPSNMDMINTFHSTFTQ